MKSNSLGAHSGVSSKDIQDKRPPLMAVYQALDTADDLARAVNNFLDTLFGGEPTGDSEHTSDVPSGILPRLEEHADGTRRRIGRTYDRLNVAFKELNL